VQLTPLLDPFSKICHAEPLYILDRRVNIVWNVQIAAVISVADEDDLLLGRLSGVVVRRNSGFTPRVAICVGNEQSVHIQVPSVKLAVGRSGSGHGW